MQTIGGVYANQRPTEFLCLTLKLLQLQPEKEILMEYLTAEEFKCVAPRPPCLVPNGLLSGPGGQSAAARTPDRVAGKARELTKRSGLVLPPSPCCPGTCARSRPSTSA